MDNFIVTIGLEIHLEMNTKTKMFSSAPLINTNTNVEPNTLVTYYDLAFPGTLPIPNKQVIINAIQMCHALNMNISNEIVFDRKNYFYSDLPKGYQITQNKKPIGLNGYLNIDEKKIGIEELHIEEDTAKQLHFNDFILADYNRAGIPLLEIVSKPCIHSVDIAVKYVKLIRDIAIFLEISNGKMEEGNLRCDVNISVSNNNQLGSKVEIKNINSFEYIKDALNYEINEQIKKIKTGVSIIQETKYFDEKEKKTKSLRLKNDSVDYKYFLDTNILPIKLSQDFINNAIKSSKEIFYLKHNRYIQVFKINNYLTNLLLSDLKISKYFDECIKYTQFYEKTANWIVVNIMSILNKNNIDIDHFSIKPIDLASLINDISLGNISDKIGREIFNYMLKNQENSLSLYEIKKKIGIVNQVSDINKITQIVEEIINNNISLVNDFHNGKSHVLRFLIGQVMKQSKGLVNPSIASKIMIEKLKKK